VKVATLATAMHLPVATIAVARTSSPPRATEMAMLGSSGAAQELSVDDYLVGGVTMFDAMTALLPAGELS
jgi:phosphoribosylpyrophosphate synthetase